jgi:hypothetical protein
MPDFSPILTSVVSKIFHILAILITYDLLLQQHFTFELPVFSSFCSRLRLGKRPQAEEFLSTAEAGRPIPPRSALASALRSLKTVIPIADTILSATDRKKYRKETVNYHDADHTR